MLGQGKNYEIFEENIYPCNSNQEAEGQKGLPASKALEVCSNIAVHYFTAGNHLTPYLDSIDGFVIRGTGYMGN